MASNHLKKRTQEILSIADVRINGERPWDIQIHDERFYSGVLRLGSLGLGESYMDGWWDALELDQFFFNILSADLDKLVEGKPLFGFLSARFFNPQKKSKAFEIGERHYDLGNDLFRAMLDKRMTYSCGYWKDASTLDEAQEAKLELICQKLGLVRGQTVLDIGCGWGSFAQYAAQNYGVVVVGITVSQEQAALAQEKCKGLPVEIRFLDYRGVQGTFDHVVSVGMFEHVGYKNYREFMEIAARALKPDGLFLLHTIGGNKSVHATNPWTDRYIFPNSMLPSIKQLGAAIEGLFVMEDWHNFGAHYDKTLLAWFHNFEEHWSTIRSMYDERFYRMWKYYLLSSAGSFRARKNQLWQIVLSPKGVRQGYNAPR